MSVVGVLDPALLKSAPALKRVIIEWTWGDGDKAQFCASVVAGYAAGRIWLNTLFGEHAFSRADGRWMSGPCLNLENARIHQFATLEKAIRDGALALLYEVDQGSAPSLDGSSLHPHPDAEERQ